MNLHQNLHQNLWIFNDDHQLPHPTSKKPYAMAIAVGGTDVADALGQALRCTFHLFKGGLRDLSVGNIPEARISISSVGWKIDREPWMYPSTMGFLHMYHVSLHRHNSAILRSHVFDCG